MAADLREAPGIQLPFGRSMQITKCERVVEPNDLHNNSLSNTLFALAKFIDTQLLYDFILMKHKPNGHLWTIENCS